MNARALTLAVIALTVCGCGSINPERMVPKPSTTPVTKINASVRVLSVTGEKKNKSGDVLQIGNKQFEEALLLALQQSGLFNEVSRDHGDINLAAIIQSEELVGRHGFAFTTRLVMTYRFTDSAGKPIWTASYSSEGSAGGASSSAPAKVLHAFEASASENLRALIQGISRQWPHAQ